MEAQVDTLCLLPQPKGQQQFKNKKQPELTKTVWKSHNKGVKEDTFIQTGSRGRHRQVGREDLQQGGGWWTQRGGRLWSGAGKAAAGRPRKVVAGRAGGPTLVC